MNAAVQETHRWAENIEISATYSGVALIKVNQLPCTESFWQFHFKQIVFLYGALFFSEFVRLFEYIALSHAYKLVALIKNIPFILIEESYFPWYALTKG